MFIKTNLFPARRPVLAPLLTLTLGLLLLASTSDSVAQSSNSPNREGIIFTVVEQAPEFPGGMQAFQDYLATNVRYPAAAESANVKGKVFVSFIVREDGRITDVNVVKGLRRGCNEEAIRVISTMPNWTPGRQAGRPVNVKYNVVVPFGGK